MTSCGVAASKAWRAEVNARLHSHLITVRYPVHRE